MNGKWVTRYLMMAFSFLAVVYGSSAGAALQDLEGTTADALNRVRPAISGPAFVNTDATARGRDILVAWTAEGEQGILLYQVQVSRDGGPFHPVSDPLPVSGESLSYAVAFGISPGDRSLSIRVEALLPDGTVLTSRVLGVRPAAINLGGNSLVNRGRRRASGASAANETASPDPMAPSAVRIGERGGGSARGPVILQGVHGTGYPSARDAGPNPLDIQVDSRPGGYHPAGSTGGEDVKPPSRAVLDGRHLTVYWEPDEGEEPETVNIKVACGEPRRFRMVAKGLDLVDSKEGFSIDLTEEDAPREDVTPLFVRIEMVLDDGDRVLTEPIEVAKR